MTDKYCNDCFYSQDDEGAYNGEISLPDNILEENNKNEDIQIFNERSVTPVQNQITSFNDAQELFTDSPGSPRVLGIEYTPGYLRTIIGRRVNVTFLIGSSTLTDRTGILTAVGISYIILQQIQTNTQTLCDIYSIKFVRIFN
ncbi:hypothetical protein [Clostridium sp.]|jgi:hypothetical protein|uniref:hypothetical protein n=1 Tax=Clostridium sp. TaxID=1506 RepID=UPI00258CB671|nr:hypothetical protein [Clostridium sp.]MDF2505781.1 hypothetical protein [Clostridium sp.]